MVAFQREPYFRFHAATPHALTADIQASHSVAPSIVSARVRNVQPRGTTRGSRAKLPQRDRVLTASWSPSTRGCAKVIAAGLPQTKLSQARSAISTKDVQGEASVAVCGGSAQPVLSKRSCPLNSEELSRCAVDLRRARRPVDTKRERNMSAYHAWLIP